MSLSRFICSAGFGVVLGLATASSAEAATTYVDTTDYVTVLNGAGGIGNSTLIMDISTIPAGSWLIMAKVTPVSGTGDIARCEIRRTALGRNPVRLDISATDIGYPLVATLSLMAVSKTTGGSSEIALRCWHDRWLGTGTVYIDPGAKLIVTPVTGPIRDFN